MKLIVVLLLQHHQQRKALEELFLDKVKPNPTKKDQGKSKRVPSRAQLTKLLPNKCNVGITKNTSC